MSQRRNHTHNHRGNAPNSPTRPRISKKPMERRQEIIRTAFLLFSKKGFENTTIQDIAAQMNVSVGLCYRYFKSKTEIFEAACELYASESLQQTQIPMEPGMSAVDKLNYFIKDLFDYTLRHKEFEANYHETTEIRTSRIDKVAAKMVENLIPVMEQGIQEGEFHCENLETTTRFIVFGMLHTFHEEIPAENIEDYIHHFVIFIRKMLVDLLKIDDPERLLAWNKRE
ncbi:TetR/AcrR family transcriptional regulator [Eubacterium sp. 1001713B170207_170306_E7]|uniref:TetR/AcrR family transcriptional regulator n=1 Tax=Eubacterium sp. 1001713B170207_170306_E7 TaxID=2787097 RepID=UPI00189C0728|nr:TetR/AcrR family transcriptional regulator [Eubacterium sp. 1001713B170207_170306_E7]